MKLRLLPVLICAAALYGTIAFADEAVTEQTSETAETTEKDYSPEQGTGWMSVKINDEKTELNYTGSVKGMTGTVYSFEGGDFEVNLMFNKNLKIGEEMDENAITQIEVVSSDHNSVGYYFIKKSSKDTVISDVLLSEGTSEDIMQGEFSVTVPSADRYVGDNKPGILPELEFTEGEFCFFE